MTKSDLPDLLLPSEGTILTRQAKAAEEMPTQGTAAHGDRLHSSSLSLKMYIYLCLKRHWWLIVVLLCQQRDSIFLSHSFMHFPTLTKCSWERKSMDLHPPLIFAIPTINQPSNDYKGARRLWALLSQTAWLVAIDSQPSLKCQYHLFWVVSKKKEKDLHWSLWSVSRWLSCSVPQQLETLVGTRPEMLDRQFMVE